MPAARTSGPIGFAKQMEVGMEGCPVPSPAWPGSGSKGSRGTT